MTNIELVLNMLAEAAATEISIAKQPNGFNKSAEVATQGAQAAKAARKQIENNRGKTAVSRLNAKTAGKRLLSA